MATDDDFRAAVAAAQADNAEKPGPPWNGQVSPSWQQGPTAPPAPAPGGGVPNQAALASAFGSAYKPPTAPAAAGQPPGPVNNVSLPTQTMTAPADTGVGTSLQQYDRQMRAAGAREAGAVEAKQGNVDEKQALADTYARAQVKAQADREAELAANKQHAAQLEEQTQKEADARHAAWEQQAAKTRAMHTDPNKWFKDRGTAGSILAALSMGAGAFAAAMPHSGSNVNQAGKIIQDAVDRDVKAQGDDIDKAFKDLDYKGKEDERQYVQGQHKIAQANQRTVEGLTHAQALATDLMGNNANQMAVKNLGDVKQDLEGRKQEIFKDSAKQQLSVRQQEEQQARAAAAAAAAAWAADPRNPVNIRKDYVALHQKVQHENAQHPEKLAPMPSLDEFVRGRSGVGAARDLSEMPGGKKTEGDKDKKVDQAVSAYGDFGQRAITSATPGNALASYLPRWAAPGANMAADHVNTYNNTVLPQVLKGLESRMTPEQVDQQKQALTISPWMSEEQKKARVVALQKLASTSMAFKNAKGTAPESDTIEGAVGQ